MGNTESFVSEEVDKSVIDAFRREVIQGSPDTPTPQAVDAFLGTQTLTGADKQRLRGILIQTFQIRQGPAEEREAKQIKFQPDGTLLQPKMAALPVPDNAPPGDYVTADPDPVLPDTKKMAQLPSMGRGGSDTQAGAYTWNLAAYQQQDVAGQYKGRGIPPATVPPTHVREMMSTMAGTVTQTNDIYGPRVPKERGVAWTRAAVSEDSSRAYPPMTGPGQSMRPGGGAGGAGGTGDDGLSGAFPGGCKPLEQAPPIPRQTLEVVIPNMPKTEPVPFLGDFSGFYK